MMYLVQIIVDTIDLGSEVLWSVDANEHVIKDKLALQLQKLVEAYDKNLKTAVPASCFRGIYQIDSIWNTNNIMPTIVSMTPFHFGVGDQKFYVVDFQIKSILVDLAIPLFSSNKRHVMWFFPIFVQRYLEREEPQFTLHNITFTTQQLKEQWRALDPLLR